MATLAVVWRARKTVLVYHLTLHLNRSLCRLQKEKQAAELASAESHEKAAAAVEDLQQEVAAAEQRVLAAQVRARGRTSSLLPHAGAPGPTL